MSKSADAFRTISEVAEWLDTPAHVLRFWESKFTQVKPVKRAGGRRYYRPSDMRLLGGIKKLLHDDGMTIKGVQKILREQGIKHVSSLCELSLGEVSDPQSASEDQTSQVEMAYEDVVADPPANEPDLTETTTPAEETPKVEIAVADTATETDESAVPPLEDTHPEPESTLPGFLQRSMADRVAAEDGATAGLDESEPDGAIDVVDASVEPQPSALTYIARISHLSPDTAQQIAPILDQLKAFAR
jgi:DNA-binding transcriptional MerR regulator